MMSHVWYGRLSGATWRSRFATRMNCLRATCPVGLIRIGAVGQNEMDAD